MGLIQKKKNNFWNLEKRFGIVFQNPENQIIFNHVHDDIAFALQNLALDEQEKRIQDALEKVGMEDYIQKEAYDLSLGQKQRITIAGVLSIQPKVIILDEPTAMLDPEGKEEIRKIVKNLKEEGFTIIYITNMIDEVLLSDQVVMLEKGRIIKQFATKDILENLVFLKEKGITIPKAIEIMEKLEKKGIKIHFEELI